MKSLMMIAVAALCCAAFAEGSRKGALPRGGMGGMPMSADPVLRAVSNPKVAEKLGLTEEQQAKLKEVTSGDRDVQRANQKKVRDAMMKQVELMKSEKIDEKAVMSIIDEVFELRKEMAKEQAKRLIAVKSILTSEQLKKAQEELQSMRNRRGERGPRQGDRKGRQKKGAKDADAPAAAPEAE